MSYIRCGWVLQFVEGDSKDYVFPCGKGHVGCDCGHKDCMIEDYGKISDSGLVELLCLHWDVGKYDEDFKWHLIRRLAKRLNVKLRNKPMETEMMMREEKINNGELV
jgi:hypothetical protein